MWDTEYLIAEYKEGGYGDGGFATRKSSILYVSFIIVPMVVSATLARHVLNQEISWPHLINGLIGVLSLGASILWTIDSLTHSYLFVTNQRIGYYLKIFRLFKLPPKWLDLNEGHCISGTQQYWQNLTGVIFGFDTKEKALKNVHLGLRLDKYGHIHQRINLKLNMGTSIYLLALITLITSKTKAVLYNAPLLYPSDANGALMVNYRFVGSHIEDVHHFFKTIDQRGILRTNNVAYMGKTNMERLADFFESIEEGSLPSNQFDEPMPGSPETILAYLPGSVRGRRKSPLIALTTHGVQCYKQGGGKLTFEYSWTDPNVTVGISNESVNIIYKQKKVINMYWDIMDIPIIALFNLVGVKQIHSSEPSSFG